MTYEAGDLWRYRNRIGEEDSLVHIVRIDDDSAHGAIFHLYITGIEIRNGDLIGGVQSILPHMPVSRRYESLTEKLGTNDQVPEEFDAAYASWREAFDAGEAGVFDVTIAEIIQAVQNALADEPFDGNGVNTDR
jgi:hypothetical protein